MDKFEKDLSKFREFRKLCGAKIEKPYYQVGDKVEIIMTDEKAQVIEIIDDKYYVVVEKRNKKKRIFHESEIRSFITWSHRKSCAK